MELKEQILKTAKNLFFELGVKRVSVDDVCNDLRISKKTFYTAFKNKEELIENVLMQFHEESSRKKLIDDDMNIIDFMFCKNSKIISQQHNHNDKHFQMFYDLKKYYPKIFEWHNILVKKDSIEIIVKLLDKGIKQGVFRKDLNMELMPRVISDIFGQLFVYMEGKKGSWVYLMDFFIDMMIRVVCNEKGMEQYLELRTKN